MNLLSIGGFTNLGYRLHARDFDSDPVDMSGRTVLVTGATGGIGLATATELASVGAQVLIVGRSEEKLAEAQSQASGSVPYRADLSSMAEIRRLADRITGEQRSIDVLINNVGVLFPGRHTTGEGLEATLATNLAGHFLLTNLILPTLIESAPSRVINVSSGGMYTARINPELLLAGSENYRGAAVYAQTKRAQVILTEMWAECLENDDVAFHAMHPGWVKTEGVRTSLPTFNKLIHPLLRSPDQGADTAVWLASSSKAGRSTGRFWFDRSPEPTHLRDSTRESPEAREKLWRGLVDLTGSDVPTSGEGDA